MRCPAIYLFLLLPISINGQNKKEVSDVQENLVNDARIKTVQLYRTDWNLSYPVINLDSDEKFALHFDLLGNQPETYYYTFSHCDKDWKESGAFINDYLEGFAENPVENYEASFNTTVEYFHYSIIFPNERVSLKISGNYIIKVFIPGQPENPVIKQRFMITEDAVDIVVNAHRPRMTSDNNTHQQVDFNVRHQGFQVNDPYRNIYAFILQNGRWDNARENLKPEFYSNNELKYSALSDKNIFPGGNEFRYFDIKSIRYVSEYIRNIEYSAPYYNVYLHPSENREFKPYFYWKDFNGKFYIASQEGRNPDTDADYVFVYFTLPSYQEVEGGKMYVAGALNNWNLDKNNIMNYNNRDRQYECALLLKQGWYNYEFVFQKDGESTSITGPFEGNHYETENDYLILIYYRNPRERYDRLIGSSVSNTLNRITD